MSTDDKTKTFWSIAALVYAPTAAVTFGILWVVMAAIGEPMFATPLFQFDTGVIPIFLGIAISFGVAVPIALVVARAMLARPEKQAMDRPTATRLPQEG